MDDTRSLVSIERLDPSEYAEYDRLVDAIRKLKASGFLPEDTPEITLPEARRAEWAAQRKVREAAGGEASLTVNASEWLDRMMYSD